MTTTADDDAEQTTEDIAHRLEAARLDVEERMDRLSQQLLGKPHERSVGAPASEVLGDPMTAAEAVAASAWHRMGLAEAVLQEQQQAAERAVDALRRAVDSPPLEMADRQRVLDAISRELRSVHA